MRANGIVTLLSDFGLRDPYVGVMKGAMLSVAPGLQLVDMSHELPPHSVETAAFFLRSQWRHFPEGTTHLVVVDPGVGSPRRALVLRTEGACFVAPDNGVLEDPLRHGRDARVFEIPIPPTASRTFHGRDLFGPVAARIASGRAPWDEWSPIEDPVRLSRRVVGKGPSPSDPWEGFVIEHVDLFGNLITDIDRARFGETIRDGRFALEIGGHRIVRLRTSYAEASAGEVFAIWGSLDSLEISMREDSAARCLEVGRGCDVRLYLED